MRNERYTKLICIVIILILSFETFAQREMKNDKGRVEKYKVRKVSEYAGHYTTGRPEFNADPSFVTIYNIHGNITEEIIRHEEGYVSAIRKYDDIGNLASETYYLKDGSVDSGMSVSYVYKYGEEGNILSKIERNLNGTVYIEYVYEYDGAGKLIMEQCSECPEKIYKYDDKGRLSEISFSEYHTFYKYEDSGELLEKITYQGPVEEGLVTYRSTYKYDETGRKLEETDYDHRGSAERKISYIYDEKGFLTEERGFYSNIDYRCRYNYDTRGLISERIEYEEGDVPTWVAKYVYDYYVKW
ncbi:MAG: hypothetical protein AB9882_10325 [Ignavibacteriaceae bacterium]